MSDPIDVDSNDSTQGWTAWWNTHQKETRQGKSGPPRACLTKNSIPAYERTEIRPRCLPVDYGSPKAGARPLPQVVLFLQRRGVRRTANENSHTVLYVRPPTAIHSHPQHNHGFIIIRQTREGGAAGIIAVAARAFHLATYLQRAGKLAASAVAGVQALDGKVRAGK